MKAPPEPLSEARAAELRDVIARLHFRFAKTMADIPHEYVVRSADNQTAYAALLKAIRAHGVPGEFQGRTYRYLYPGDGWRYWLIPPYPLINRARLSDINSGQ
jgi:hypothetical protein